jgi:cytochrome c peroxidase
VLAGHVAAQAASPVTGSYRWDLPFGFPIPIVPVTNPMTTEKVRLGQHLFFDQRLSGNGQYSCASCHQPELAFTDGRPTAIGSTGEQHRRNSMALANVAFNATFGWASTNTSLEKQLERPLFLSDPVEMGMAGSEAQILTRLREVAGYRKCFRQAFPDLGDPFSIDSVIFALASYMRSLLSGRSSWDRLLYEDEQGALSSAARRGMRVFFSPQASCSECHGSFNLSGAVIHAGSPAVRKEFHNTGLYDVDGRGGYPDRDEGLRELNGDPIDSGKFRAPSLRNVAVTAPYMHDGSVADLREAVAHYAAGGRAWRDRSPPEDALLSRGVRGIQLDDEDIGDLVAFLESLTDDQFLRDPRHHDPGEPDTCQGSEPGRSAR